jgi:anaerobic magnesium-protoporphyrin IX monomethyl ester cyclase
MPKETEETMEKTIRLALELDPDLANFMIAAPCPGTRLCDLIEKEGNIFGHDWADYAIHTDRAKFEIGGLKAELVERKWREAHRRFYWRPKRLVKRLMMPDTWRHLPARLRDARRFLVGGKRAAA